MQRATRALAAWDARPTGRNRNAPGVPFLARSCMLLISAFQHRARTVWGCCRLTRQDTLGGCVPRPAEIRNVPQPKRQSVWRRRLRRGGGARKQMQGPNAGRWHAASCRGTTQKHQNPSQAQTLFWRFLALSALRRRQDCRLKQDRAGSHRTLARRHPGHPGRRRRWLRRRSNPPTDAGRRSYVLHTCIYQHNYAPARPRAGGAGALREPPAGPVLTCPKFSHHKRYNFGFRIAGPAASARLLACGLQLALHSPVHFGLSDGPTLDFPFMSVIEVGE